MSKLPSKINKDEAKALPWEKMLTRHELVRSFYGWESQLGLAQDTLRKASIGARGLSSKTYHILMNDLIRQFSTGIEFRQWLYSSGWPQELINRDKDYYRDLYARINQGTKLPAMGLPPRHYLSRHTEEEQIVEVLTGEFSEARGVYISGEGGVGKTTLIAGTLYRYLSKLNRSFDRIVWVDLFDGDDFGTCIHQIISGLDLKPKSQKIGGIVDELRGFFSKHSVILVCNAMHALPELQKLVQLVGVQGRILITSRARLPRVLAENYRLVHLELPAMDEDQGEKLLENMLERSFMDDEKRDVVRVLNQTGGLPLALVLVASLAVNPHISMASLANRLESHSLKTLAIPGVPPSPETSVRISLEITYDYLREYYPQAATAFVTLGVFTRPYSTIQILRQVIPASLSEQDQDRIISLMNFHHLITLDELDGVAVWQMHPLLHELAKEYLLDDPTLSESQVQSWTEASIESLAELRGRFQRNRSVARIFDLLKYDLLGIALDLLRDGQIIKALNVLENASALLTDAGYLAEYQSLVDHLKTKLSSINLPAGPMKCVVSNFVNLHTGAIHASLNEWEHARELWQKVNPDDVDDPEFHPFILAQIVKARAFELIVMARTGTIEAAKTVLKNAQDEFSSLRVNATHEPKWQEALIEYYIVLEDWQSAHQAADRALALVQEGTNGVKALQIKKTIVDILVMEQNYLEAEIKLKTLLQEEISSLSIKAELQINLSFVLMRGQKPGDALVQLDEAEDMLSNFPEDTSTDYYARLWTYRAWCSEQLGWLEQAHEQAHKALLYWRRLPNSNASQQTVLKIISKSQKDGKEMFME